MPEDEVVAVRAHFPKPLTKTQARRAFGPYAEAIGRVAYSWNHLHEQLRHLFTTLFESKTFGSACAVWYSTESDLQQRKMLAAAVQGAYPGHLSDSQKADIQQLLVLTSRVGDARNNAIHAPLLVAVSTKSVDVIPDHMFGHRRGENLKGKDLLYEFRWCDEAATVLRDCASQMWRSLTWPETIPWPGKPRLPERKQRARE